MLWIFEWGPLIFCGAALVIGFLSGSIVRGVKGDGARSMLTGLEAGLLATIGALLAGATVSLLLSAAGDSPGAAILVGFGLFLWVGAINLVSWLATAQAIVAPAAMVWIGLAIGGCAGLFAGIHRVYNWKGLGWLAFPLDVTWGLAGTTNGCLIHLINVLITSHAPETRHNGHRYTGGFRIKGNFAFTQGAVMSNLGTAPPAAGASGPSLYRHEMTHVWQNRVFGPLFTLTFLIWMGLLLVPGLIAGAVDKRASPGKGIEWWSYYDNPWEVWAYQLGGARHHASGWMCWPAGAAIVASILFYPPVVGLLVWPVWVVWFS